MVNLKWYIFSLSRGLCHPLTLLCKIFLCLTWIKYAHIRDVNRFWSSRRKLKSSRQIDADGTAVCRQARRPLHLGVWDKWCKILHSRPLLALNFIIETSFFCTIFLIFSAIVQDKRPFFTCWLQRCIKILFLQCNLIWKPEQLTNYKCSLIQYGDENDSEVLLYTDLPTLTILA